MRGVARGASSLLFGVLSFDRAQDWGERQHALPFRQVLVELMTTTPPQDVALKWLQSIVKLGAVGAVWKQTHPQARKQLVSEFLGWYAEETQMTPAERRELFAEELPVLSSDDGRERASKLWFHLQTHVKEGFRELMTSFDDWEVTGPPLPHHPGEVIVPFTRPLGPGTREKLMLQLVETDEGWKVGGTLDIGDDPKSAT